MVLSIDITSQAEARLRKQAQAAGKDVKTYVSDLVEQAAARPSLDEVLAPLRNEFEDSGISDQELIEDITEAQAQYRAENHKKTA